MAKLEYHQGCRCDGCGEEVAYSKGRRRCYECHKWCHDRCSLQEVSRKLVKSQRSICIQCSAAAPNRARLTGMVFQLDELECRKNQSYLEAGLVYVASLILGTTDEGKISEVADMDPCDVSTYAARLRRSKLWIDGEVPEVDISGLGHEPNPQEFNIAVLLGVMCASGYIERHFSDDCTTPSEGGWSAGDVVREVQSAESE